MFWKLPRSNTWVFKLCLYRSKLSQTPQEDLVGHIELETSFSIVHIAPGVRASYDHLDLVCVVASSSQSRPPNSLLMSLNGVAG